MKSEKNRCEDCPYRWKDKEDDWPICHWVDSFPGDKAPCEYEDECEYDDFSEYEEECEDAEGF